MSTARISYCSEGTLDQLGEADISFNSWVYTGGVSADIPTVLHSEECIIGWTHP